MRKGTASPILGTITKHEKAYQKLPHLDGFAITMFGLRLVPLSN